MDDPVDARAAALLAAPLDRWVALSPDQTRVIAVGATFEEAVREAEKLGVTDPVMVKTPEDWIPRSFFAQPAACLCATHTKPGHTKLTRLP